jgi:uncharacterized Zn finger protein
VSRPRKPFGTSQPGRLPATMMKVLAAEMSDPARHRRGKQYAGDGSVLDIIIEPGVATCEIQGSRSVPYVAMVHVTPGSGMPLRRHLTCTCSCPDDDNWDGHACKHVVATLYTMSNEFLIEPELLDVWRGQDVDGDDGGSDGHPNDELDRSDRTPNGTRRHLSVVRDLDDNDLDDDDHDDGRERESARAVAFFDPLEPVLRLQSGTQLPDIPVLDRADLRPPKDRDLATALRDAMLHVRVEWD